MLLQFSNRILSDLSRAKEVKRKRFSYRSCNIIMGLYHSFKRYIVFGDSTVVNERHEYAEDLSTTYCSNILTRRGRAGIKPAQGSSTLDAINL